jgi:hypothetical protein
MTVEISLNYSETLAFTVNSSLPKPVGMKTLYTVLFAFFALLPITGKAQLLESLGNALGGAVSEGNVSSFDSDLWWFDLLLQLGYYPTVGLFFGFEGEPGPNEMYFARYPYAERDHGLYLPIDEYGYDDRRMRTAVTAHFQSNEDALFGGFLQVKFSPNRFLTLDVNRLQLFETLDDRTDQFAITNFNLQYNRIRMPRFHLWWGGGLMLLENDLMYGSPSVSAGFDWFIKRPVSLHADTQFGFPNGVFARQHQLRVQMHLNRYMIYAGYEGIRASDVKIPNWTMGTGVWF